MPRKRWSEEQIVYAVKQSEAERTAAEICRELGVSEQTFYTWKRRYRGIGVQELRALRQLRDENRKLKHVVADLSLDRQNFVCSAAVGCITVSSGAGKTEIPVKLTAP